MSTQAAPSRGLSVEGTLRLESADRHPVPRSIARYELLTELGRGAMARVYLARDPNIDRKIALKVLDPRGVLSDLEMRELRTRFLVEARAAGKLRHPAAVAIYDADHDPDTGHSFIAMEWVDGQSLDARLRSGKALPLGDGVSIIAQVAAALDAAHQQGLIHRDVKPGNILIDCDGNAKLSDFGIAKVESLELTSTGQVLGTPCYMSPEQILDDPLDGRSDLFSLGVVLYQCLTGSLPFQADSLPSLMHKILNVDPTIPRQVNPSLPDFVSDALMKALAKHPGKRFQTGAELSAALHREAQSMTPPTARWPRLRPAVLLPVAAIVAILVGFLPLSEESLPGAAKEGLSTEASTRVAGPVDGGRQPVSTTSLEETAQKPVAADAMLMISYTNRLKEATMDVWIDGNHVSTQQFSRPPGVLKRATGRRHVAQIPVSAGHHDVKVRIQGKEGKITASNWTGKTFGKGGTQLLRLELIPPKYLKMTWK